MRDGRPRGAWHKERHHHARAPQDLGLISRTGSWESSSSDSPKKHLCRLPSCTLFCHQTSCWVPRGFCPPTKAGGHGASGSCIFHAGEDRARRSHGTRALGLQPERSLEPLALVGHQRAPPFLFKLYLGVSSSENKLPRGIPQP